MLHQNDRNVVQKAYALKKLKMCLYYCEHRIRWIKIDKTRNKNYSDSLRAYDDAATCIMKISTQQKNKT